VGEHDYTTIPNVRAQLGIPDGQDDVLLGLAITAASRAIDNATGTQFHPVTETREYEAASDVVWVDRFLTTDGLTVATGTDGTFGTTVPSSAYAAAGIRISGQFVYDRITAISAAWPRSHGRPTVAVTATWGWPEVPEVVEMAARIKAAQLFSRKDSPFGVAGNADFGIVRINSREDPHVWSLLAPYTDPGIA
jgi:hypothetical protein